MGEIMKSENIPHAAPLNRNDGLCSTPAANAPEIIPLRVEKITAGKSIPIFPLETSNTRNKIAIIPPTLDIIFIIMSIVYGINLARK